MGCAALELSEWRVQSSQRTLNTWGVQHFGCQNEVCRARIGPEIQGVSVTLAVKMRCAEAAADIYRTLKTGTPT